MSKSTILVETRTRERLKHQGRKGQTYDELINRLIDTTTGNKKDNQDSLDRRIGSLQSSESRNP